MGSPGGKVQGFEDFEADSDDEAIGRALQEAGEQRIELWRDRRKIAAISGREEPPELTIATPDD